MTARRKKPPPQPEGALRMAFPRALSARLRDEAVRRGVKPYVLVGAAMARLVEDSLLDAVLDGDDATQIAPGYAFLVNGLTRAQGAVIYLLAKNSNAFGVAKKMSPKRVAAAVPGLTERGVERTLLHLAVQGLACRAAMPDGDHRAVWALTEDGWRVAHTLGDFARGGR